MSATRALLVTLVLPALGPAGHAETEPREEAGTTPVVLEATVGARQPFSPDLIGFNGNIMGLGTDPWSVEAFAEAARTLRPRTIRYPAGTLGNYWDWDLGWLDPGIDDRYLIGWVKENGFKSRSTRYTLEHLRRGARAVGFKPVYVANMLDTHRQPEGFHLEMMSRALKRAKEIGLPVEYVELGNEYYFRLPLETHNFETPERYGEVAAEWIQALRPDHPDAKFALIGGGPMNNSRNRDWTRRALSTGAGADAVTVHVYTGSGLFGREERKDFEIEAEGKEAEEARVAAMSPEEKSAYALERLGTSQGFADMMWTGHRAFPDKLEKVRMPEDRDLRIWVTEWNITHRASGELGTWANALFIALMYESMLADGRVELSHVHNLLGNRFAVIYEGTEPLAQVAHRRVVLEDGGYRLAPAGLVSVWLGEASRGAVTAAPLRFEDPPRLASRYGGLPAVYGWVFGGEDGTWTGGWLIHLQSEPQVLRLGPGAKGLRAATHYSSEPAAYTVETAPAETHTRVESGSLTLPPFSITVLGR